MTGNYTVKLSTSQGFANMLLRIGIEGKSLSYLDEYPELVKAITLADLQKAAALIPLNKPFTRGGRSF